ncbi:MAG: hypothetical protein WBD40_05420 [Tepidisphaeraceae bacterium]
MQRRHWFAAFTMIVLALTSATPAGAAEPGPFEFTLAGAGSSDKDFDATQFSGDLGLGFHLGPIVLGARQTVTYTDSPSAAVDDFWSGSTRAFADLEIALGPVAPFIGANIGYIYGDLVKDQFIAGPEAGVKIYVGDDRDTFIFFRIEYQFFFEDSDQAEDAFEDGQFVYALGVGFRF